MFETETSEWPIVNSWYSRQALKNWSPGSCVAYGFCYVYNTGNHLYVGRRNRPGDFIDKPLEFFRFKDGLMSVNGITLLHMGHDIGFTPNHTACVNIGNDFMSRMTVVPPGHVVYAVRLPNLVEIRVSPAYFLPLPNELLKQ